MENAPKVPLDVPAQAAQPPGSTHRFGVLLPRGSLALLLILAYYYLYQLISLWAEDDAEPPIFSKFASRSRPLYQKSL